MMPQEQGLTTTSPHWSLVKLEDCGEIYCGQSPSVAEVNTEGRGEPYFTGPEQWDGQALHVEKWTEHPKRLVPDGCIFITVKGAGVGTLFPGVAGAIGRDIYAFRVHAALNFRYIFYALRHTIDSVVGQAKGDIPGLSKNHILDHTIVLPSVAQQNRIVAKIEELFSELDKGVESLTTAREQLKVYRQALLNAAVTGQLLVASGLRRVPFGQEHRIPIRDITSELGQGWSPRCHNHPSPSLDTWGVMKTTAIQHLAFDDSANKELPAILAPRPHLEIKAGDVLVTRAGPRVRVGVACLVRSCRPRVILCDKAYRIRTDVTRILPEYLELVLNSPSVLQDIETLKTGINDSGVNLTQDGFMELRIPVPSLREQVQTLSECERNLSIVRNVELQIEGAITREASLRQSILKKAFSGQLITQEPNDDPASALLEDIRSEKQQIANGRKKTKKEAA